MLHYREKHYENIPGGIMDWLDSFFCKTYEVSFFCKQQLDTHIAATKHVSLDKFNAGERTKKRKRRETERGIEKSMREAITKKLEDTSKISYK